MKITAVIPARYSSTRFEGKALADILGKPMVQHVYERTIQAKLVGSVIVATDAPETMGLSRRPSPVGQTHAFWNGSFGHCNMVALRLNNYTYCAVGGGGVSHEMLTTLLSQLLPE